MKPRAHGQKRVLRRIRRERRRLGRFVVFAEMLADLRPISLLDQAQERRIRSGILREQGAE
jgi:hypothetical protein